MLIANNTVTNTSSPILPANAAEDNKKSSHNTDQADQLSITSLASRLNSIESDLSAQPVIDKGRVEEIQSAIIEGNYQLNIDSIATKMITFESMIN